MATVTEPVAAGTVSGADAPPRLRALLWDVDGTLAETERDGHRVAFNLAFEACGVGWSWDEAHYIGLLGITGGRERLLADMQQRPQAPRSQPQRDALARAIHARKNLFYADMVAGGAIGLRGGVRELIAECGQRGVRLAIATTTSRSNLDALLRVQFGADWTDIFGVSICGEDVLHKKPDPEVYRLALHGLGVAAHEALAIEDAPAGVAAARGAGVAVIVTRSACFADAPIDGALAVGPGLGERAGWQPALCELAPQRGGIGLDDLERWRSTAAGIHR